jgi:hypothetical protein
VFPGGIAPLDSKGRGEIAAVDVPLRCGGVLVEPAISSSATPTASWSYLGDLRRKSSAARLTRRTRRRVRPKRSSRDSRWQRSSPDAYNKEMLARVALVADPDGIVIELAQRN